MSRMIVIARYSLIKAPPANAAPSSLACSSPVVYVGTDADAEADVVVTDLERRFSLFDVISEFSSFRYSIAAHNVYNLQRKRDVAETTREIYNI